MLESFKAPFATRVAPGPPFLRFGGLVLRLLAMLAAVGSLATVAWMVFPMFLMADAAGLDRLILVIAGLTSAATLISGAIVISMLGTTLRFWEAGDPRGRRYAVILGVLAFLAAASQAAAVAQGAPPAAGTFLIVFAAAGAALVAIGLHPAGKASGPAASGPAP